MIENLSQLFTILLQTTIIFISLLLLYKKFIFSIFDPLFYFVITQAFSIELAIIQIHDLTYLFNFLACQLFFAAGFLLLVKKPGSSNQIKDDHLPFSGFEYKFWSLFTIIGSSLIILANIYLTSQKGIILLANNPTSAKVMAFEGGGGIGAIKRINWGLLNLMNLTSVFMYSKTKEKKFLILLVILVLIGISGGSKGSLLIYVSIIALLGLFKSLQTSTSFRFIDKLKVPFLIFGIGLALFIIGLSSLGFIDSMRFLLIRFLYFGDIILFYYNTEAVNHFQQLGTLDFINYELNSILGLLRIVPYIQPLSFEMVKFSLAASQIGNSVMGPNLPYYVKGHIFFGSIGAPIYSLLVGMIIGYVRGLLSHPFKYYSQYILIVFINMSIFGYAQDSSFTISMLTDTLLFALIPIFISMVLLLSPKKKLP